MMDDKGISVIDIDKEPEIKPLPSPRPEETLQYARIKHEEITTRPKREDLDTVEYASIKHEKVETYLEGMGESRNKDTG